MYTRCIFSKWAVWRKILHKSHCFPAKWQRWLPSALLNFLFKRHFALEVVYDWFTAEMLHHTWVIFFFSCYLLWNKLHISFRTAWCTSIYSGVPIFWTSDGNENCLKNWVAKNTGVKLLEQLEGNDIWFKLRGFHNQGFQKSGPHIVSQCHFVQQKFTFIIHLCQLSYHFTSLDVFFLCASTHNSLRCRWN